MADATLIFTVPVELKDVVIDVVGKIVGIKDTIYSAAAASTGEEISYATSDAKEVEKEKEKEEESFEPPTFETVRWYMRSRRSPISPERFYNWMEKHNWHDGNGQPIVDWKKKVEDWEARQVVKTPYKNTAQQQKRNTQDDAERLHRLLNIKEDNKNT